MTTVLQVISFVVLLVAFISWGQWVWHTNRTITAPERLSQVLVHGIAESDSTNLSNAIAVGVIGRISEHIRTVSAINNVASSSNTSQGISALTKVSQPAPSLLKASKQPKALDVAIEFAGSKIETTGLQSLFSMESAKRGGISISLLLESGDEGYTGVASSSFPENSAYGFSIPVAGSVQEIAEKIGMRFVQAHYAAEEPLYSALDPEDFRLLWRPRKQASDISIREKSGSPIDSPDHEIAVEAQAAYKEVEHLLTRYTSHAEIQKLAAYLSTVGQSFHQAIAHLNNAKNQTPEGEEYQNLEKLISNLTAVVDSQTQIAFAETATFSLDENSEVVLEPKPERQPKSKPRFGKGFDDLLVAMLSVPELKQSGISQYVDKLKFRANGKTPKIALVLGEFEPFPPFEKRIQPLDVTDQGSGDWILEHTQGVATLIGAIAPYAEVRVIKALTSTGGTKSDVIKAIARALAYEPDVIILPLGPFTTKEEFEALTAAGENALVLIAAGNEGEISNVEKIPGVMFVGSGVNGELSSFSNYGESIDFYAPGSISTFGSKRVLEQGLGTTYSVAIAGAMAANLVYQEDSDLTSNQLASKLLALTQEHKTGKFLQIAKN